MNYNEKYDALPRKVQVIILNQVWPHKPSQNTSLSRWKKGDITKTSKIDELIKKYYNLSPIAIKLQCTLTDAIRVIIDKDYNLVDYTSLMIFRLEIEDRIGMDYINEQLAISNASATFNVMFEERKIEFKLLLAEYLTAKHLIQ